MFAFPQPWTKIKFDEDIDTLLPGEVRGTGKNKNYKFRLKEGYTMDDHAWAIKWIQACNNANFTADDVYNLSEGYGVCSKHWNKELIDGVKCVPYVIKKGNRIMPPNKPPEIVPANINTNLPAPASLQVKTTPARTTNVAASAAGSIGSLPSLPSSGDNDFLLQTKQLNMQDTLPKEFVTLVKNITSAFFLRKLDLNFDKAALVFSMTKI